MTPRFLLLLFPVFALTVPASLQKYVSKKTPYDTPQVPSGPFQKKAIHAPEPVISNSDSGDILREGYEYTPGTMEWTAKEALGKCEYNPATYTNLAMPACVMDTKTHVVGTRIPKVGSSSLYFLLKNTFPETWSIKANQCFPPKMQAMQNHYIGAVRDPYDRWFSQYEQVTTFAFKDDKKNHFPAYIRGYLDGLETNADYEKLFCLPTGKEPEFRKYRLGGGEIKELTRTPNKCFPEMNDRHDRFVDDLYNWPYVFDTHLTPQVKHLLYMSTHVAPFSYLYDVARFDEFWKSPQARQLLGNAELKFERESSWPRRLNTSAIPEATQRQICQLYAIDYCCLNYRLPPACKGYVTCRLEKPAGAKCTGGDSGPCITVKNPVAWHDKAKA